MIQQTHWIKSKGKIVTQYGRISGRQWLIKEKARILTKNPDRTVNIRTRKNSKGVNETALFVDDVGGQTK
jgi:hypothetical protein